MNKRILIVGGGVIGLSVAYECSKRGFTVTMDVAGGIYFPKDCQLTPARFLAVLQAECVKLGVEFCWNAEVTGWNIGGGRINSVATTRGECGGDEVVLCGGSWSPTVARGLGLNIPIQAGKGYSLTLAKPRQLPQICSDRKSVV